MANIIYDGLYSPDSNILTFTDVPNILKVEEYVSGTYAEFTFTFVGNLQSTVTREGQYYVTFLGETVTSTMSVENAKNKMFYIAGNATSTAASFARALRNCGGISSQFNIIHTEGADVKLSAKTIGAKWSSMQVYIDRNIPNTYLRTNGTDGTANSSLYNALVSVDVYSGATAYDYGQYITTLEKNYYGNECAFDVSPVLSTFSEYGKTKPYLFIISMIKNNGIYESLGEVMGYNTIGYLANQSDKYLFMQGTKVLMNKERGDNGTILYTYSNKVAFSVLCGSDTGGWTQTYTLYDSALNVLNTYSETVRRTSSENYIFDREVTFAPQNFANAYYVDITVGNETVRFNVIKPINAAEGYQRVYWRNEYGGVSFFDFTGQRTENDNFTNTTYEKNIFDFYDEEDVFEQKKIYSNTANKEVILTSHLMEKDGTWIFNSLMRSKNVWTFVNGNKYYIIPKKISVDEDQTYNDVFVSKLTYEYSYM